MKNMDEELEKMRREMGATFEEMMGVASSHMMPAMGATAFIEAESRAWDVYVCSQIQKDGPLRQPEDIANFADEMLKERRKRFNLTATQVRLVEALRERDPQVHCGQSLGDGKFCVLEPEHNGEHSQVPAY